MPKIRKLKRSKKFRVNVNRKRLRNKLQKLPNIECKIIKEAWEKKQSAIKNLEQMGLAFDANKAIKIPNIKKEMLKMVENETSEEEDDTINIEKNVPKKLQVVQSLEEDAKWPRAKLFRLPNNEVQFATYMMDKYGDDFEAMVRDRKNYYQLTANQIRRKIERFKSIPEQYAEYLVKKGEIILEDPVPLKKLKPEILQELPKKKSDQRLSRRKRQKSKLLDSIWQEESIEDVSIMNVKDTVQDINQVQDLNSEKKLKLFDDEDDDDDDENSSAEDAFNCTSDEENADLTKKNPHHKFHQKISSKEKKNESKINKKKIKSR